MTSLLDRQFVINNVMDRIDALERKLRDMGEGPVIEVTPDVDPGRDSLNLTEGPDIDVVGSRIGRGGDTILLFDSGANPVAEFAATSAGFDLAIAAATSGDTIWLPSVTISGDHVLSAGIHHIGVSRFGSVLTGQITGGAGASLENCSVTRSANSASALYGIVAPATGTCYMAGVHVSATQAGAGNAAAIYAAAGGNVEAWNCSLRAPAGGAGWHYGVYHVAGQVYVEGGVCHGATAPTNWSP